jgi:hypothetical protein
VTEESERIGKDIQRQKDAERREKEKIQRQ